MQVLTQKMFCNMKSIIRKNPWLSLKYWQFRWFLNRQLMRCQSVEEIFARIYKGKGWRLGESVSGPGSDLVYTETISKELPRLVQDLGVKTLLDIPCRDFNWMKEISLDLDLYIGADIVEELIMLNNQRYAQDNSFPRRFEKLDVARDRLPKVDLVLCRDCLVHLSSDDIFKALQNIKKSGSKYLLCTTYTDVKK